MILPEPFNLSWWAGKSQYEGFSAADTKGRRRAVVIRINGRPFREKCLLFIGLRDRSADTLKAPDNSCPDILMPDKLCDRGGRYDFSGEVICRGAKASCDDDKSVAGFRFIQSPVHEVSLVRYGDVRVAVKAKFCQPASEFCGVGVGDLAGRDFRPDGQDGDFMRMMQW